MTIESANAFTPLDIGPLTLRNRYVKAATNEGMSRDTLPTRALVEHHRSMAAGGAAMTTLAYCAIAPDGRTFEEQILLSDKAVPHLRVLTDAVHAEGGAACAQITHCGAFSFLQNLSTRYPYSASTGFNSLGLMTHRWLMRGMKKDDMERIAGEFVAGARRAEAAGFDAIELHMGHGYLLSQFLSPLYNHRRDAYGGDAARRARYPAEVLQRVLDAVGDRLAVGCKISVTEGCRRGATAEDSAVVSDVLERAGAHFITLSGGMNVQSPWEIFGNLMPDGVRTPVAGLKGWIAGKFMEMATPKGLEFHQLYHLAEACKVRAAVKLPLFYLGGVRSLDNVDAVLAKGFDAIQLGRPLIHDPGLVNQFRDASVRESGCTNCNECVVLMYTPGGTGCVLREPNDPKLNEAPVELA